MGQITELDRGGMCLSQRFQINRTAVGGLSEVRKTVDIDISGSGIDECSGGGDFSVNLHRTAVDKTVRELDTGHALVVDESAAVGKSFVRNIIGAVGEVSGIDHAVENGTGGTGTDQNISGSGIVKRSGNFRSLGNREFSAVADFSGNGDTAVNDKFVGIGNISGKRNCISGRGDMEFTVVGNGHITLDSGSSGSSEQIECTCTVLTADLNLAFNIILSSDFQFTVIGNQNTVNRHIQIGLDGNDTALDCQTVITGTADKRHTIGIAGNISLGIRTFVDQSQHHGTGIGNAQFVRIGDGSEAVGVVNFHEIGVIHITEGVSGRVDRKETGVGELALEHIVRRINGEMGPAFCLKVSGILPCAVITAVIGGAVQGFALDLDLAVAFKEDISTAGVRRRTVIRLQRM